MSGWVCIRSGPDRGCWSFAELDAMPVQQELFEIDLPDAAAPAPIRLPAGLRPGELPDCTGPCARPMKPAAWLRQRGRCSTCGPARLEEEVLGADGE